jgi:hypothetical protein
MGNIHASSCCHGELQKCATQMKQYLEICTILIASCQLYFIDAKEEHEACTHTQQHARHYYAHDYHLQVAVSSSSSSLSRFGGTDDVVPHVGRINVAMAASILS